MFKRTFFLAVLVITFSSCHKVLEYYNYKEPKPSTGCRVTKITNASAASLDTTTIQYHSNGYPSSVTYSEYESDIDYTTTYIFHYTYDHLNRLTSETSDYVYGRDLIYYAYEGDSKLPVRDTVRALYLSFVEDLEYDAKGRIIQITRRDFNFVIPEDNPGPHPDQVVRFYYDFRGNRQPHSTNLNYSGMVKYNDKPSLVSLHPVWQLIHKNYSRNSVDYATTFNDKGLPLTITNTGAKYFQPFLDVYYGAKIEYDCED